MTTDPAAVVYLFTTHLTRNKIIAIVVVAVVVVAALGFWLMRRGKARA